MPLFRTEETLGCWVTFKNIVEAPDAETARNFAYQLHEASDECRHIGEIETEVGDVIDGYDAGIDVISLEIFLPSSSFLTPSPEIHQGLRNLADFHADAGPGELSEEVNKAIEWINKLTGREV